VTYNTTLSSLCHWRSERTQFITCQSSNCNSNNTYSPQLSEGT